MKETKRKAYLAAMGIDICYPRILLPELKESFVSEFKNVDNDLAANNKANTLDLRNKPQSLIVPPKELQTVNSVGSLENKTKENGSNRAIKQSEEELESESISGGNSLRFSLNFYHINSSLAIIDEFPVLQSETVKAQSLNLLSNIVSAFDIDMKNYEFGDDRLMWPIAEGLEAVHDETLAAQKLLSGFIERKSQQNAFENLLVFAGVIGDFLVSNGKTEDDRDYLYGSKNFHITITHSLHSMLSFPQLKRDVWLQLQPLKERIKEN